MKRKHKASSAVLYYIVIIIITHNEFYHINIFLLCFNFFNTQIVPIIKSPPKKH